MRIAVIAPSPIPARTANSIQVMKMTQAFVSLGHQVNLIAPRHFSLAATTTGERATPIESSISEWKHLAHHYGLHAKFPIVRIPAHSSLRRYDYALRSISRSRTWQADLVYTRLPQAASIASKLGINTVFETHDFPKGFLGVRLFKIFLNGKGSRKLVVISRALANDLRLQFSDHTAIVSTIILSDGVDLDRYAEIKEPLSSRKILTDNSLIDVHFPIHRFTAGYTGHLYQGRGIHLILEIASLLPDVNFILVGGEPDQVLQLGNEIKNRNLENVYCVGFVPNADLPLYQAACDVLMMPYQNRISASSGGDISRYLSPMKLFEYMACGRPILSSDIPVLKETLTDKNAIILPMNDAAAWVSEIQKLISDQERRERLGCEARKDVKQYTWESRAAKILEGL